MRRSSSLLAFLLALPAAAETGPFGLSPSSADPYLESFTFVSDLDDGTFLHVQLAVTNVGPGAGHGVCRLVVADGTRPVWGGGLRVDRAGWKDSTPTHLQIGTCEAEATENGTRVRVALDDASVDLVFVEAARARDPVAADVTVDGARYVATILHERAPVHGTLKMKTASSRDVRGFGYADHSRSEVVGSRLARRWVRFRALGDGGPVLLLAREGLDGAFSPAWAQGRDRARLALERFDVSRSGAAKEPSFRIAFGHESRVAQVQSTRLLYRSAPVEELGVIGHLVKPFVGSPVTYMHRAALSWRDGSTIEGILEVSLGQE